MFQSAEKLSLRSEKLLAVTRAVPYAPVGPPLRRSPRRPILSPFAAPYGGSRDRPSPKRFYARRVARRHRDHRDPRRHPPPDAQPRSPVRGHRSRASAQLRNVMQGLLIYANENKGSMPYNFCWRTSTQRAPRPTDTRRTFYGTHGGSAERGLLLGRLLPLVPDRLGTRPPTRRSRACSRSHRRWRR